MDELPELPFEKVLSYLSLEDRLRLSAVSRSCHQKIANSRAKSLCYSERPIGLIYGKSRWVSGAFAQNFISSTRFASFFDTYGQTIFSNLKHLRLCDLDLRARNESEFVRTLNSFGRLETLDMVRVQCSPQRQFQLNLQMLTSLHLDQLSTSRKLILDAPRLRTVRVRGCSDLKLDIVHGESVERFITSSSLEPATVKNLRNLKYLHVPSFKKLDSTFLSSLEQLKEIHLQYGSFLELFEQKQRYNRSDLKIYLRNLLLNGPDDPARNSLNLPHCSLYPSAFVLLVKNSSRLADEIPFYKVLTYWIIELVASGLEFGILNRLTDLDTVHVNSPVQDVQRFLNCLKNIVKLEFVFYEQPQELFDLLPEHCAVQKLLISLPPSDLGFLFRLEHLFDLEIDSSIDVELVRKAFEELPLLSRFRFEYLSKVVTIEIDRPKQFRVSIESKTTTVLDLNAAIEFFVGEENKQNRPKKRKADD